MRGRNGGRGNFGRRGDRDDSNVKTVECGSFVKLCQGDAIFKISTADNTIPFTKTFLYDSKKNKVGTVKDVFGPLDDVSFVLQANDPNFAKNLKVGDKIYAPEDRLRNEEFFCADQNSRKGKGGKRGGGAGGRGRRGGRR